MNRKDKKKIIVVIIIVLAAFFIAKRKIELAHAPVVGQRPLLVHADYIQKKDISYQKEYLAEVRAINQANIAARINAVVEEIYVDEGSLVKKGDLLASLDQRDLKAKLSAAKAAFTAAKENLSYWKLEYKRDEDLFENGAISEEERDRAKNSLAQAQSGYTQAKENADVMDVNLSYAQIIAPFDGVVANRMVDPGDLATVGKPLFVVNDQSRLKLVFSTPQSDILSIKKGQHVFFKNRPSEADVSITNIFPSLEKGRVVIVEAYLAGQMNFLPGEFVPVKVTILEKKDVIVAPKESVIFKDKKNPYVFLIEDHKLRKVSVQIGVLTEDWVEVKNIPVGSAVVDGSYFSWSALSEGQVVTVGDEK